MKRILRYSYRALIMLVCLFIVLWATASLYVMVNKKHVISKIQTQISDKFENNLLIGDITPEFFETFPYISIRLKDVKLRDSLWKNHRHDLLSAGEVYLRINPTTIFSGKPKISKLIVRDATLHFFTDSNGYANRVERTSPKKQEKEDLPDFEFKNTRFIMENHLKHKFHDLVAEKLTADFDGKGNIVFADVKLKALVHGLAFNTQKGSYLQEKRLEGKFRMRIQRDKGIDFNNIALRIEGRPYRFSGNFATAVENGDFKLNIEANSADYKKTISLLPGSIRAKLDSYNLAKPFYVNASISGKLGSQPSKPLVVINADVKKNSLNTPIGDFAGSSFLATFSNELVKGQPRIDENSSLVFTNFSGEWENMPLSSRKATITNLKDPVLSCDLISSFDLSDLNELTGSNTVEFEKGKGKVDIKYTGSLKKGSDRVPSMNGNISLSGANIRYLPRNLLLTNCSGNLAFNGQDVSIRQLKTQAGNTDLVMNGSILNFLSLVNKNPEQLVVAWNISTPNLNLNDFLAYIGKRSTKIAKRSSKKSKLIKTAENIDRMLKDGVARVSINAGKLSYKKFHASNIAASVSLEGNSIVLNNASLNHGGGRIAFSGSLVEGNQSNHLALQSNISRANIPALLAAFSNFGQDAITSENMRGILTATVNMSAYMSDKAEIIANSLAGTVDFNVSDGELINFEPARKISEKAFKKRDFGNLRFGDLKNRLTIKGSEITIPRMEIRSSAIFMFVEGVYDPKKGTDMSIQVPVSNLKKPDPDAVVENTGKAGLSLRLRAQTGSDGKLKVNWDPFKKKKNGKKEEQTKIAGVREGGAG